MADANERAQAARLLEAVICQHQTTDQSFGNQTVTSLVSELVYGTLRHYFSLTEALDRHLSRPLRSKDQDLYCLMLVGAYQLRHLRIPAHAAVHATVDGCRTLRKPWAAKLVNAVLRAMAAEASAAEPESAQNERSFELPDWLKARLEAEYGGRAPALMGGLLKRAPMCLRVNQTRTSVTDYTTRLNEAGIAHRPGWMPESLYLEVPVPARKLPGLASGEVSIQDAGALFACGLLTRPHAANPYAPDLQTADHRPPSGEAQDILDACAAPGGKLFHLAEACPDASLWGVELSRSRLEHLRTEARRLGHNQVNLIEGDATEQTWWPGQAFDAILLDAPCSGTGTWQRNPHARWTTTIDDVRELAATQTALLEHAVPAVKPGGRLVYAVCTLTRSETTAIAEAFTAAHPEFKPAPLALPGHEPASAIHLWPHELNANGMFIAAWTRS
ncbi:MAG: 16S rRNA (cytosine(967)-C(5))-methyltransferase RsmB [Pseudomonadales bacterium]|nr:16S rRNA (cytosine(967)-C(5))-methyltransferase RsmB [Pseudomonadales bacterium]